MPQGEVGLGYIGWFHKDSLDCQIAGGKGSSLAALQAAGFPVPSGFVVTSNGYRRFLESSGLDRDLARLLGGLDASDRLAVKDASNQIQGLIDAAPLPDDLRAAITSAYDALAAMTGVPCAIRSSAVSEDGVGASFAGLYESYLNVHGVTDVLASVKRCYASLWSERAVRYRSVCGGLSDQEAMAVVVMDLVRSETSGIAFTAHPVTGERDRVVINASWGLGEAIVSGRVTPDSFVVDKTSLELLERKIYEKELAIYPHPDGGGTVEREIPLERAALPSLSDDAARAVARLAASIERHFGLPQDVEWGLAGGRIFLLQSRPITTLG